MVRKLSEAAEKVLSSNIWSDTHRQLLRYIVQGQTKLDASFLVKFKADLRAFGLVEGDDWKLRPTELGCEIAESLFY